MNVVELKLNSCIWENVDFMFGDACEKPQFMELER
jgi:hypothetical protein